MNGATAELCAKITSKPSKKRSTIIGASQKRLRTFKKSQNSLRIDNLAISLSTILKIVDDIVL